MAGTAGGYAESLMESTGPDMSRGYSRSAAPGSWETLRSGYPSVAFDGCDYHMWYRRALLVGDLKIGYAYSINGINWTRSRENPVIEMGNGRL